MINKKQIKYLLENGTVNDLVSTWITRSHEEYQYLKLLKKLLKEGSSHSDRTGTGTSRLWGEKMSFDLTNGVIPLYTTKKISLRLIVEELVWFFSGSTNVKLLQEKKVHIWDGNGSTEECQKFGRVEGDLGPIYGHQWRNFGASKRDVPLSEDFWSVENSRWVNKSYNDDGYDQLKYVVETIQNNPNSRRILLSGWNPFEADKTNPPPCHTFYQFQVDNGKLNGSLYLRSNDIFLGNAFNVSSLAIWVHLMAKVTNLEPGKIVMTMADAHLYNDHREQAMEQINRVPYPFPEVKINERLNGTGLSGLLSARIEDIELLNYNSHGSIKAKMSI